MGLLLIPQRHLTQPQYMAPIDSNPLTMGLVSAVIFDSTVSVVDRVSRNRYPVTGGSVALETPGKVLRFNGTAQYLNTGTQKLGGVDFFASAGNPWSVVIYARLISPAAQGSFIAKCGATGANRQFQLYRDPTVAASDPAVYLRGTNNLLDWDWNTADWHQYTVTWDGTAANIYGDNNKSAALSVGAAAAESENIVFGARTGGSGFLLNGQIAYAYIYNRAISYEESLRLYRNPWQVFAASPIRLWDVTAAGGGSSSYTITPSGGVTFSGSSVLLKSKIIVPVGGLILSGNAPTVKTKIMDASGGITLSGEQPLVKTKVIEPSGEIALSGSVPLIKTKILDAGGTLTLSGTASLSGATTYVITPDGGVTLSGSAVFVKTHIQIPTGNITFSGSAPMESNTVVSAVSTKLPLTGVGS